MFIKLIEIHGYMNQKGMRQYSLREVIINKKNIIYMSDNEGLSHIFNINEGIPPEGLSMQQKYTDVHLVSNTTRDVVCTVVGDLDHIYRLLETDSMLNHRQTLKG